MGGRCAASGCGRFVRSGEQWCRRHAGGDALVDVAGEADEAEQRRRTIKAAVRQRLAAGEYRGLFGAGLGRALAEAATERGLADEIGVLRITLARLLIEEEDLGRLATSVARVAGVAIQAARAHQAITADDKHGLEDVLTALLAEA